MRQWLSHPLVRGLLVGAIIIALASALKVYMDRDEVDPAMQRAQIDEHLLAMHDAVKDALSEAEDRDAAVVNLPTMLPWLPTEMPCAGEPTLPSKQDASDWKPLGWPLVTSEAPREYAYQITMRRRNNRISWIARRDRDCDGIYEVHTLHGDLGWGDAFKTTYVETQHLDE